MKALIKDNKVVDIASETFPVHPSFVWIEAPDNIQTGDIYTDGRFIAPAVSSLVSEEPAITGQEAAAVSAGHAAPSRSEIPVMATTEPETKTGPKKETQPEMLQRLEIHIHIHR